MTVKGPTFCWWCTRKLVGKGGVAGKEPLFYKMVNTPLFNQQVRVHCKCEEPTKSYFSQRAVM